MRNLAITVPLLAWGLQRISHSLVTQDFVPVWCLAGSKRAGVETEPPWALQCNLLLHALQAAVCYHTTTVRPSRAFVWKYLHTSCAFSCCNETKMLMSSRLKTANYISLPSSYGCKTWPG
uniref:Putative secreted protein n=1 Tax=Ixodes ricinus TaxID=34613 RepID=A0A147BC24_IXORI